MLKLNLQYSGHLTRRANLLEKTLMLGKMEIKRAAEGDIVKHHWLSGHEFEQTPGYIEGQGSLAYCSLWGCKELDTTEWLNNLRIKGSRTRKRKKPSQNSGKIWQKVASACYFRGLRSVFDLRDGLSRRAGFLCSCTGQWESEWCPEDGGGEVRQGRNSQALWPLPLYAQRLQ